MLTLLEQMTIVLRHALRPHAARLVPLLAAVLERDTSAQRVPSLTALGALEGFGPDLPEFSGLLLPPMVALVADASPGSRTLLETLEALRVLSARARSGGP